MENVMVDFLFTIVCGVAIGWLIPSPTWFHTLVGKIKEKLFNSGATSNE
jgi:hypothetical protein